MFGRPSTKVVKRKKRSNGEPKTRDGSVIAKTALNDLTHPFVNDLTKLESDLRKAAPDRTDEVPPPDCKPSPYCYEYSSSFDTGSTFTPSWKENEEVSLEQFRQIKARTMYNMVEDLGDGRRLLFLTNAQADLIAASRDSLQKMLDALEIPKPKLVINLLCSLGWDPDLDRNYELQKAGNIERVYGLVPGRPPFLRGDKGRRPEVVADEALDKFMLEVLIPLAAQTNAIVFCAAEPRSCVLSRSFTTMVSMQRAKWGSSLPFFVLSTTKDVDDLVRNQDPSAYWRQVSMKSRAWTQRSREIDACLRGDKRAWSADGKLLTLEIDLDPNAMCFLIGDGVGAKDGQLQWDGTSFTNLVRQLINYLSSSIPSIAFKTGQACSSTFQTAHGLSSSLSIALNRALSGTPVLLLDVVQRPKFPSARDRADLIQAAQAAYDTYCNELLAVGVADVLDACILAHFHRVLQGELHSNEHGLSLRAAVQDAPRTTLHEAIKRARQVHKRSPELVGVEEMAWDVATPHEVSEIAAWIACRRYYYAWEVFPDVEKQLYGEKDETYETFFKKQIQQHSAVARSLLSSPNVHSLNLVDEDVQNMKHVVGHLVKLDRLPKQNRLEGLFLLQEAWSEYDVAMKLAAWYKLLCKFTFITQLVLTWLISVGSVGGSLAEFSTENEEIIAQVVFGLAAAMSILVSLDGVLSSKARWRKLRMSAGVLEASIWCYRARVGKFSVARQEAHSNWPEVELRRALNEWREDLVTSAGLAASSLQKVYPARTYRHGQYENNTKLKADDHFSPVRPEFYIRERMDTSMEFYQRRIPKYIRHGYLLKGLILLLGVASSVLAHLDLLSYTVIVSSASSAMTSWSEFADISRKVERYSNTVLSLKKLMSWWKSLDEVERAAAENISVLICTSENIISEERFAWVSAGKQSKASTDEADKPEGTSLGKPAEPNQSKL